MTAKTEQVNTNPFPGLRPFREDEEYLFFGRENQVDAMVDKLAVNRFLAVIGTSGCGKSSLVNCGLRPALHGGLMSTAGTAWRIAQFRPGSDPLRELARALAFEGVLFDGDQPERGMPLEEIVDTTLRLSKLGLIDIFKQARLGDDANLLVVVDQFEELFRYRQLESGAEKNSHGVSRQATEFVNLLLEAARQEEYPIHIVITMRSDFLGDCAEFAGLTEEINEGQYLVPRMTREERRAAISGPVRVGGAEISPVLLTRLVNDVGDNPDQLSILQHALNRTWARWKEEGGEGPLEMRHYEAIGTMSRALDQHAERAFSELDSDRQQICEKMFKALTDKATDPRGIRRPTKFGMLCALADASEADVADVIETFRKPSRSFMMPPAGSELQGETVVDISHESLMRVWQRLQKWAEEEARSARIYKRVAETAVLYSEEKAGLWQDPDLQLALNWRRDDKPNEVWAQRYHPAFDPAMDFLEKSKVRRWRERALAAGTAAGILILLVGALVVVSYFLRRATEARRVTTVLSYDLNISLASREINDGRMGYARSLLIKNLQPEITHLRKFEWYYLWGQLYAELGTLEGSSGVQSVAFTPDGKVLATGSRNGSVKLWDLAKRNEIATIEAHTGIVNSVVFSPDGKLLASGSRDGTAKLWNAATGKEVATLNAETGAGNSRQVWSVAFAPDGQTLATGSYDGSVRLWDVATLNSVKLQGHPQRVNSVAFSPDGKWLASGSNDDTVKLWDVASRKQTKELSGHASDVMSVAFAPIGNTLATGGADKTIRIWDIGSQAKETPVRVLAGHSEFVQSVTFSPDGKTLASGSWDRSVKLWDLNINRELATLSDYGYYVYSVQFSPDGKTLATGVNNGDVKLWDMASTKRSRTLGGYKGDVNLVAFSPDGKHLATASNDMTVKLWNVESPTAKPRNFEGHSAAVNSIAYSPDGKTLASGSGDKTVRLWNSESPGSEPRVLNNGASVSSVAFSPDGMMIAVGARNDNISLWDLNKPEKPKPLKPLSGHEGNVWCVAFSPDGKKLASGSEDDSVMLWDMNDPGNPRLLETLSGHDSGVRSVAFSPDGNTLATASDDNDVKLWDMNTFKELATLKGHSNRVWSVAFSPDGKTLASGSRDQSVKLWDSASYRELATLSGNYSTVFTVAFAPDGMTLATGDSRDTVRLYYIAGREEADTSAMRYMVRRGVQLAEDGNVDEAIAAFEEVQELDPEIDLDPNTEGIQKDPTAVAKRIAEAEGKD